MLVRTHLIRLHCSITYHLCAGLFPAPRSRKPLSWIIECLQIIRFDHWTYSHLAGMLRLMLMMCFWRWRMHQNVIYDLPVEPAGLTVGSLKLQSHMRSDLLCQLWLQPGVTLVLLSGHWQKSAGHLSQEAGYGAAWFRSGLAGTNSSWMQCLGEGSTHHSDKSTARSTCKSTQRDQAQRHVLAQLRLPKAVLKLSLG